MRERAILLALFIATTSDETVTMGGRQEGLDPSVFAAFRLRMQCRRPAYSCISSNISLPTPQSGHAQSSGTSSHGVPALTLLSGSPTSGS